MSAEDTVLRVLRWAIEGGTGPPPRGDLRAAERLAHPDEKVRSALGELASVGAARLRLGEPPLEDTSPLGLDGLVLAAALGSADLPELALALLATVEPARTPWSWVLRHGLAAPALAFAGDELADALRGASPLTALLERPPGRLELPARVIADRLRLNARGRLMLQLELARPTADPAVRRWRTRLLDGLRVQDDDSRALVLEVYEAAMVHHEEQTLAQTRAALAVLTDALAAADEARLEDALAAARWWAPLRALEKTHVDELRGRRHLGYAYREGLKICGHAERLRGAA